MVEKERMISKVAENVLKQKIYAPNGAAPAAAAPPYPVTMNYSLINTRWSKNLLLAWRQQR